MALTRLPGNIQTTATPQFLHASSSSAIVACPTGTGSLQASPAVPPALSRAQVTGKVPLETLPNLSYFMRPSRPACRALRSKGRPHEAPVPRSRQAAGSTGVKVSWRALRGTLHPLPRAHPPQRDAEKQGRARCPWPPRAACSGAEVGTGPFCSRPAAAGGVGGPVPCRAGGARPGRVLLRGTVRTLPAGEKRRGRASRRSWSPGAGCCCCSRRGSWRWRRWPWSRCS